MRYTVGPCEAETLRGALAQRARLARVSGLKRAPIAYDGVVLTMEAARSRARAEGWTDAELDICGLGSAR